MSTSTVSRGMRVFDERGKTTYRDRLEVMREARAWAKQGGLGLHVWDPNEYGNLGEWLMAQAPRAFKLSRPWAHLFGQDFKELERRAAEYGVREIVIDRPNTDGQHIDLCGVPLVRAMEDCEP